MFILRSREEIESLLRAELEAAEECLQQATLREIPGASEHFKTALRRFARFVLHGEAPTELRHK